MRTCAFELNFKEQMSNIEIEGVEAIVKNLKEQNEEFVGEIDGFVYTSSSQYAVISVDGLTFSVPPYIDNSVEKDELEVSHFAITRNDILIMVCEDENENYYYFEIEPNEFY